jgi:5-methylcytosine-specific restriction enzyme A
VPDADFWPRKILFRTMPTLKQASCSNRSCPQRARPGARFCAEHEKERWRELDRDRRTAAARGYDSKGWRAFRPWFLLRHPLCEDCLEQSRLTPASEVHHLKKIKTHPELRLVESNCRALDRRCHSIRTLRGE